MVPVFASVGKIYELRLMIEFSGTNRTYCYVRYQFTRQYHIPGKESNFQAPAFKNLLLVTLTRYCNDNDAKNAVKKLHNYRIRLS